MLAKWTKRQEERQARLLARKDTFIREGETVVEAIRCAKAAENVVHTMPLPDKLKSTSTEPVWARPYPLAHASPHTDERFGRKHGSQWTSEPSRPCCDHELVRRCQPRECACARLSNDDATQEGARSSSAVLKPRVAVVVSRRAETSLKTVHHSESRTATWRIHHTFTESEAFSSPPAS